jgi:phosphoglycolate phosphatase
MNSPINSPLLVLDLDGTLADTAADLIGTLNVILEREGHAPLPLDSARELVGAGAKVMLDRGFKAAAASLTEARVQELFEEFLVIYEDRIADETVLYDGVAQSLSRFSAAGWRLAVCTNKMERPSVKLLTALGMADRFAAICGQDTFRDNGAFIAKPDARALLMTIARAGGDPANAIMVGDSRTDILTARNAGIPVVAVDFGYTDVPVRELGPDRVISHFDALWDCVASLRG